jgi:hypothetical protein
MSKPRWKLRKPWLGQTQVKMERQAKAALRRLEAKIDRMAAILHAENRLRATLARIGLRRSWTERGR